MKIRRQAHKFVLNRIPRQTPEWISRGYTLFFILSLAILVGSFALIPSITSAIQEEKWISFAALAGSYAVVLIILFKKNLGYYVRSYILCFCFAVVGYVSMSSIGLVSSARLWFLCAAVVACLLIGGKSAFAIFVISFIVFVGFGYKTGFTIKLPSEPDHIVWTITSTTFVLVNILVVVATYLIVSGLKKAEATLRESGETHRALVDGLPDIVMRFACEGRYLFVSDNVREVVDIEAAQFIGKTNAELGFTEAQCRFWDESIQRVLDSGTPFETEFTFETKTGPVLFNCRLVPERGAQGEVSSVLSIVRDITKQKRAEKEREKLQAQLNQAQKMESVGRLAGGVAHDFNNKLSIINGYAELAMEKIDPSDPLHETIQEIHTAGKQSAEIVRQLLAFAREQTISPVLLDLNDTISSMLKMLQRLIGENINLEWHPGNNLWPVKIDPSQVDQIMANLAVNSRDAISDVGKLTIETDNIVVDENYYKGNPEAIPGQYVLLAVSDNGCGMEKEVQKNLFEPFFTTKELGKGTGLGLPTIYGIVKQNKGFINVYSEPGEGTIFKIYLPSHEEDKSSVQPAKKFNRQIPTGTETVLVVEDEKKILQMSKQMLERLGYSVETAGSPAEALQISKEHGRAIHLLITDVVMPEMNGRDLSAQLVKSHPGLKTLYMSGYTANVIAHHGVLEEGVKFIQKPFSLNDLALKVREVIDQE